MKVSLIDGKIIINKNPLTVKRSKNKNKIKLEDEGKENDAECNYVITI